MELGLLHDIDNQSHMTLMEWFKKLCLTALSGKGLIGNRKLDITTALWTFHFDASLIQHFISTAFQVS